MSIAKLALRRAGWQFPDQQNTEPEVFIIESLRSEDEEKGRFEGWRLSEILRLAGASPKYFYIHNESELELLVPIFLQSRYRYLHFSCHGLPGEFILNDGTLDFERFAEIFQDSLNLRRLFVSACSLGERSLADELHKRTKGMHSVVAPSVKIRFDHAAAIWAAFYISLLENRGGDVQHQDILTRLRSMVELFPLVRDPLGVDPDVPMRFMFAGYASHRDKGSHPRPDPWDIHFITPRGRRLDPNQTLGQFH